MIFWGTVIALVILIGIAFTFGFISAKSSSQPAAWWSDYQQGISTEMLGAIITTITFSLIIGTSEYISNQETLKTDLIYQLASSNNSTALNAVEELRIQGWLSDGTLRNANLIGANLQFANLTDADLSGVDLSFANLANSVLNHTNFSGSTLYQANLSNANTIFLRDNRSQQAKIIAIGLPALLGRLNWDDAIEELNVIVADIPPQTNFTNADLYGANLANSDFSLSEFSNAILLDTQLEGANLILANFTMQSLLGRISSSLVQKCLKKLMTMKITLLILSKSPCK